MVRYELILISAPKLAVADLPVRMGDMPEELSHGTLQRALEKPELLPLPVAWGDNRKRLQLIQRRISITGGDAEIVDHAGVLRRTATRWRDVILSPWLGDSEDARNGRHTAPTAQTWVWTFVVVMGVGAAALWWRGGALALPPWVKAAAPRTSGFLAGLLLAHWLRIGVLGLRDGRQRGLALGCLLLSLAGLGAAGKKSNELGLITRAVKQGTKLTHRELPKPNMKPFTALLVELERRQQRQEMDEAMQTSNAAPSGDPAPSAATSGNPALSAAASGAPAPSAAQGGEAVPSAAAGGSSVATAAVSGEPATSAVHPLEQSSAGTSASAHLQPQAAVAPASGTRVAAADGVHAATAGAPAAGTTPAQARSSAVSDGRAPRPKPQIAHDSAPRPVDQIMEAWRSIEDVNPIHGLLALLLALATFGLGFWTGQRRRSVGSAAGSPQAAVDSTREQHAVPPQVQVAEEIVSRSTPPTAADPTPPPLAAAPVSLHFDELPPANDAFSNEASAAITAASVKRLADQPRARSRQAAVAGRFAAQEENAPPRKRDARRDD